MKNNLYSILLLYFVLFIHGSVAFCQPSPTGNSEIDSLNKVIKNSGDNYAKAKACVALSEIIYQSDIDSVIPLCKSALDAINNVLKTDSSHIGILNIKAEALNNIGYVLFYKGSTAQSLNYYLQALALRQKTENKAGQAESYNNIGALYKSTGNTGPAISYYQKSLALYKKAGNISGEANIMDNLGVLYASRNNFDTAGIYYMKAFALQQKLGNNSGIALVLNNLGDLNEKEGKDNYAVNYYWKTIELFNESGDKRGLAEAWFNLAQIEYNNYNMAKARTYVAKSLKLAQELGFPSDIMNAAQLTFEIDTVQKNWKAALEMHLLYVTMRDSLHNEELQKIIMRKQFRYDYNKKETALKAEQEKKNAIAREEKKRQQVIIYSISVVLLLALLLTAFILRGYRQKQKANLLLEEKNHTIAEQKNEVDAAYKQLHERHKEITDSINYARRIQEALFKDKTFATPGMEHFILFMPRDIVSGDFYWSFLKDGYCYIAAVDCTGHGVPGAFLTMLGIAFLNELCASGALLTPAEILNLLKDRVVMQLSSRGEVKDGMDISLCRINSATKQVQWAGANNPLWYISGGELKEITADKQPVAYQEGSKPFTNHEIRLNKSDMLYLFTDGYADQFGGPKGKKFKYKPMQDILKSTAQLPVNEQKHTLDTTLETWKGNLEQVDDILVIGIKML